jgi:hypothetical protein
VEPNEVVQRVADLANALEAVQWERDSLRKFNDAQREEIHALRVLRDIHRKGRENASKQIDELNAKLAAGTVDQTLQEMVQLRTELGTARNDLEAAQGAIRRLREICRQRGERIDELIDLVEAPKIVNTIEIKVDAEEVSKIIDEARESIEAEVARVRRDRVAALAHAEEVQKVNTRLEAENAKLRRQAAGRATLLSNRNKVRILRKGPSTKSVWLNGEELRNVTNVSTFSGVDRPDTVTISLYAEVIQEEFQA